VYRGKGGDHLSDAGMIAASNLGACRASGQPDAVLHRLEVASSAEGLSLACQDSATDRAVAVQFQKSLFENFTVLEGRDGVAAFGARKEHHCNGALAAHLQDRRHGSSFASRAMLITRRPA